MSELLMRFIGKRKRPLIMSDPLVLQTERGIKTVTRRIINPQPNEDGSSDDSEPMEYGYAWRGSDGSARRCPYGMAGDKLWLRHAHCPRYFDDGRTAYRCDWHDGLKGLAAPPKWKPGRHMRREYARTVVGLVVNPRAERLLDITDDEALLEGIPERFEDAVRLGIVSGKATKRSPLRPRAERWRLNGPRKNFLELWDKINGKREIGGVVGAGRSELNPFVWRLEYRLVVCNGVEMQ